MPQLLLAKNFRTDILSFEKIRNDGMMIEALDVYDIILIYDNVNGSIDAFIRSLHLVYEVTPGENGYRDHTGVHGRKILFVRPDSNGKMRADLPQTVAIRKLSVSTTALYCIRRIPAL